MDRPRTPIRSLAELAAAEAACTRCPLYRDATQVVPGEGPAKPSLLIVGEQPGDKEDLAGRPFVGPAGRVLDAALEAAGIPRAETFVTNAVKHFKHEMRGKRRLHKKPNAYEIDRCRWWLDLERGLLRPAVVVALGATAARGVVGRPVAIGKMRGTAMPLADGSRLVVTIHPSYLLHIQDREDKRVAYQRFVADLRLAATVLAEGRRPASVA
ncbi:MAG: UdgX family uracil-DNA binding protein [Variibacter sp.]|nr:UdgX family uracil-DNA binding protein [Variibacter sp.]